MRLSRRRKYIICALVFVQCKEAFIYPLYIIVFASSFYYVPLWIKKKILSGTTYTTGLRFLSVLGFIILFFASKAVKNGINLITWDKMKVWDPESTSGSGQYYPQSRVWNFGVRVTF